ncbi:hypothetical protein F4820DRAFT_407157 [Hypoxylon rubiginosum]|uniref:Uncharacterized protein n=1 Tax=Hypoxylon rubiginosum TaxID=110542 RepID=A0ACB9ZC29_9PEZI|nr:hypothetical protein F4820DRAFT_407157 [Hypoxylon rubiginosum]
MNTSNSTEPSPGSPNPQDQDGVVIDNREVQDITDLPNDLFLLVTSHLPPQDCVLCRRVSRAWLEAFGSADASWNFMRWHFSRSREMRTASGERLGEEEEEEEPLVARDWARVFAEVARRYYYIRSAKPRLIEKVDVVQEVAGSKGGGSSFRGVSPWSRWLQWNDNVAAFQHRDPTWCFDDGLLVYPEAASGRYVAYDLETRLRSAVPFDGSDKTVRRLRLTCGVLVVEWCEREPYHQLNDREMVHRHFATAFDVRRRRVQKPPPSSSSSPSSESESPRFTWDVAFRCEWKIHFLGLPLNSHDRFFSAHTATHYALYLWQPNRSPWGEEDPLEQLTVWDISSPSSYRPSLDPTGGVRKKLLAAGAEAGPPVVHRFSWRDLEFLGLRQRCTPCLREVLLDEHNVYVHEEEHRWLAGQHSSLSPPRHHLVRCTGVPFAGVGPRWFDQCCADGDVHMSFCPRAGSFARVSNSSGSGSSGGNSTNVPSGSSSGAGTTWPGRAPCWRHEEFPYLTVSDAVDTGAGVRVVARQCFMVEALSSFVLPKISVEEKEDSDEDGGGEGDEERDVEEEQQQSEVRFADDMWWELLAKGRIAGDERWVVGEDRDGRVTIVRF